MRSTSLACAALLLAAVPAAADHGRKNIAETLPAAHADSIQIDFPVGDLRIETAASAAEDTVRVDLRVTCDRWFRSCDDRLEDVRLESELAGDVLRIAIRGYGKGKSDLEVDGTITIPAARRLGVDMGVGDLNISGVSKGLDVDLGVGEVRVRMPAAAVRSVTIDAGVGDTSLRLPSGRAAQTRSFVASETDWDGGRGEARVSVDVGVGDAVVTLE